MWWQLLGGAAVALAVVWSLLLVLLWRVRPDTDGVREAVRLLPDVLRLVTRLARDRRLPRGTRVRLWLLLGYLALPVDLVPDVVPVLGYADDAVLVVWTLRAVCRRAGAQVVAEHWPGSAAGLAAVQRLVGTADEDRSSGAR